MDLQKEIDKLKVKSGYSGKSQQWQYGFDLACRELAKHSKQPQWISVEDQMPDGYIPVLVVNQKGRIRICEWAFYEQEWWKSPCLKPAKSTITHWMPLPEPPTKECE